MESKPDAKTPIAETQQIVVVAKEEWKLRGTHIFKRQRSQGITNSPILLSCWNALGETKLGSCSFNFFLLSDWPVGLGSDLHYSDYSKVYIFASPEVNQWVYDEMSIKDLISPYAAKPISAAPHVRWMIRWKSE